MLFQSERVGAASAAPIGLADDREDEMFTCLNDRCWSPTDLCLTQSSEAPDRCDLATSSHRRSWINVLTASLRQLRSRMRRARGIQRISAAWTMVDDRLLEDIGISRIEVEYARDARHRG